MSTQRNSCRLCAGRGTVRADFYPVPVWVPCRACGAVVARTEQDFRRPAPPPAGTPRERPA